jgi:hypothetical protein
MTRRRTMTARRKRAICARNNWLTPQGQTVVIECGQCVTLHDGGPVQFDHACQFILSGDDSDENIRPMTPADHKTKTRADAGARGMIRRITGQNKPKRKSYWPSGRKIQSREFQKHG